MNTLHVGKRRRRRRRRKKKKQEASCGNENGTEYAS
jgi:hypothetical protein